MKKILFINACVRENSRTLRLARQVLDHLDGEIHECCLQNENIQPLDQKRLAQRDALIGAGEYEDAFFRHAREFAGADEIVIAAPYWDLSFPAMLKAYLENITVSGVTFRYENGFPVGMCRAKRLFYITTAGGPAHDGFGYEYVKTLFASFYGIKEAQLFKAENLDIDGADVEALMQAAGEQLDAYFSK